MPTSHDGRNLYTSVRTDKSKDDQCKNNQYANLNIPQELGLVSFNDTTLCHLIEGGLSSVSLNIREIVQVACSRLLNLMEGRTVDDTRRVIVPTRLIVRGSSKRAREAGR